MLILKIFLIALCGIALLALLTLLTAYICYRITFYSPQYKDGSRKKFDLPNGEIYLPHQEKMTQWQENLQTLPHQSVSITSFDGLTLYGNYYECEKGAPIELIFHGYRGSCKRDLSGGVYRCFALKHNALLVDHRGSGKSEGKTISFGVLESRDCASWVEYILKEINPDAKIIIAGISMGASTVLSATALPLPKNVVGVLADCGYSSAEEIIKKVIKEMKLPPKLMYPFVKLGAKIFGKFDLEERPPIKAMKNCTLPVLFVHGDTDLFVPVEMSKETYAVCRAPKRLLIVKNAGHGLSFLVDEESYLRAVEEFFTPLLSQA